MTGWEGSVLSTTRLSSKGSILFLDCVLWFLLSAFFFFGVETLILSFKRGLRRLTMGSLFCCFAMMDQAQDSCFMQSSDIWMQMNGVECAVTGLDVMY